MAIDFVLNSSEYYENANGVVTQLPFSVSVWANTDVNGNLDYTILSLADNAASNQYYALQYAARATGDPTRWLSRTGNQDNADTTSMTVGTWHHIAAVESDEGTTTPRRKVWLDADDGNAGTENTSKALISNLNMIRIGALADTSVSNFWDGPIAHVCIWDGYELSPEEVTQLSDGIHPYRIAPSNIAFYCPLFGGEFSLTTTAADMSNNKLSLTANGTPTSEATTVPIYWGRSRGSIWSEQGTTPTNINVSPVVVNVNTVAPDLEAEVVVSPVTVNVTPVTPTTDATIVVAPTTVHVTPVAPTTLEATIAVSPVVVNVTPVAPALSADIPMKNVTTVSVDINTVAPTTNKTIPVSPLVINVSTVTPVTETTIAVDPVVVNVSVVAPTDLDASIVVAPVVVHVIVVAPTVTAGVFVNPPPVVVNVTPVAPAVTAEIVVAPTTVNVNAVTPTTDATIVVSPLVVNVSTVTPVLTADIPMKNVTTVSVNVSVVAPTDLDVTIVVSPVVVHVLVVAPDVSSTGGPTEVNPPPVVVHVTPVAPANTATMPISPVAVNVTPIAPVVTASLPIAPLTVNVSVVAPTSLDTEVVVSPVLVYVLVVAPVVSSTGGDTELFPAPVVVNVTPVAPANTATMPISPVVVNVTPIAPVLTADIPMKNVTTVSVNVYVVTPASLDAEVVVSPVLVHVIPVTPTTSVTFPITPVSVHVSVTVPTLENSVAVAPTAVHVLVPVPVLTSAILDSPTAIHVLVVAPSVISSDTKWTSLPMQFLYTAANWGTVTWYLEAVLRANSGETQYARLYNLTDGIKVTNSELSTTSTSSVRLRTTQTITLTDNRVYILQAGTDTGEYGYVGEIQLFCTT